MSFLKIFNKIPIGVNTVKKIIPKKIGATNFPINCPSLIHSLFIGVRNLEFNNPSIKKIADKTTAQIATSLEALRGHKPIIKNTIKKRIPKDLLVFLIFFIYFTKDFFAVSYRLF